MGTHMTPDMTPEQRQAVRAARERVQRERDAAAKKHAAEHPVPPEEQARLQAILRGVFEEEA